MHESLEPRDLNAPQEEGGGGGLEVMLDDLT